MIAADHDRQSARRRDVTYRAADLVERLLDIGRNGEDVTDVAERHLLAKVDAHLVIVGRVERGDAADTLRPETRAGAIGGAAVERHADHGRVVIADLGGVLDVGRLQESVDAGIVREFTARECRDRLVGEAVGAGEAHPQRPLPLLRPGVFRNRPLFDGRLPAAHLQLVEVRMVATLARQCACGCRCRDSAPRHCVLPVVSAIWASSAATWARLRSSGRS